MAAKKAAPATNDKVQKKQRNSEKYFCGGCAESPSAAALYQNEKLGHGMRWMNYSLKGNYVCTVCGKVKSA